MWPFKKHIDKLSQNGMFTGMTDWHSHILPGVDDGIRTMKDALAVLAFYEELGVSHVWLTPHIMEDYPNKTADLKARFAELKEAWKGKITLDLAAENMLDSLFEERLADGDLLPIGPERDHLLVETSYFNPPMEMDDIIERIFGAGYFPLLAHPERYRYMQDKDYHRLHDRGVKFQVNYASLVGGYGETARKRAEWLVRQGMLNVTGSDVHRLSSIREMTERAVSKREFNEELVRLAGQSSL